MSDKKSKRPNIAQNKKARHDYFIEEVIEAGIMLVGTEVKALRAGKCSLGESHAGEMKGELYLFNAYIGEHRETGAKFQHETNRPRKLLLHKKELNKFMGAAQSKGVTIVPLAIYFNRRGIAKIELGIATGKKQHDKRQTQKDRDWKRAQARIMRDKG